jgi:hypothetical protein
MTLVAYRVFFDQKKWHAHSSESNKTVDKFKKEITPRSSNGSFTGENAPSPKLLCIRLVDLSKTPEELINTRKNSQIRSLNVLDTMTRL